MTQIFCTLFASFSSFIFWLDGRISLLRSDKILYRIYLVTQKVAQLDSSTTQNLPKKENNRDSTSPSAG